MFDFAVLKIGVLNVFAAEGSEPAEREDWTYLRKNWWNEVPREEMGVAPRWLIEEMRGEDWWRRYIGTEWSQMFKKQMLSTLHFEVGVFLLKCLDQKRRVKFSSNHQLGYLHTTFLSHVGIFCSLMEVPRKKSGLHYTGFHTISGFLLNYWMNTGWQMVSWYQWKRNLMCFLKNNNSS